MVVLIARYVSLHRDYQARIISVLRKKNHKQPRVFDSWFSLACKKLSASSGTKVLLLAKILSVNTTAYPGVFDVPGRLKKKNL